MPGQGIEKVESDCYPQSPQHCLDAEKKLWFWWSRPTTRKIQRQEKTPWNALRRKDKKRNGQCKRTENLFCHRELLRVNERLRGLNDANYTTSTKKEKNAEEVAAKTALGELKLAQESLRKALQNKFKSLAALLRRSL